MAAFELSESPIDAARLAQALHGTAAAVVWPVGGIALVESRHEASTA